MSAALPASKTGSGSQNGTTVGAEMISVNMAEQRVSVRLTDNLVAYGLGACLGVCIYDTAMKVAGLAQIVLPRQRQYTRGVAADHANTPARFADTALQLLVTSMCHAGADRATLRAAIVGGAHIFGSLSNGGGNNGGSGGVGQRLPSSLEIGERNVQVAKSQLDEMSIPLCGEETGGSCGRTVVFRVCDGAVIVKPVGGEAKVLAVLSRTSAESKPGA